MDVQYFTTAIYRTCYSNNLKKFKILFEQLNCTDLPVRQELVYAAAIEYEAISILEYMHTHFNLPEAINKKYFTNIAIKAASFKSLIWLQQRDLLNFRPFPNAICYYTEDVDLWRWCKNNGMNFKYDTNCWEYICQKLNNQIYVFDTTSFKRVVNQLEFLSDIGCNTNQYLPWTIFAQSSNTTVLNTHAQILLDYADIFLYDKNTIDIARAAGNLELVELLTTK